MNSENFIRKIVTDISDPYVFKGEAVIYLLFFIPIICMAIEEFPNIAHNAMEHGYDIKVKAGPVDIALTKNNS